LTAVTGLRRLAFVVAALIVVVIAALGLVSLLLPADQVREAVKAEIRAVTGLDPVLRGGSSVSLFPTGNVAFSDVILGDPNAEEPPLKAERLTARLRFLPLLAGQIEVADVWLDRPRIVVDLQPDGSANWSPLIESLRRAFDPKATHAERTVSFSEIRIQGGTILVRNKARNVEEELSDVDMSLAWPAISRSFAATGHMRWHGEALDTSINVADFGAGLIGDKSGLKIRITGAPVKLLFDGAMSLRPTLKMDGTLAVDTPSLRRMLTWSGSKPFPGGGFGRFALRAQTNVVGGTVALSAVNLELDGNAAEGVLTFATDGRQVWQGTLAADSLDLSPYLSTIRLVTANERGWNRLPIELDGFDGLDLDLRLSAAKVTLGTVKLGRTGVAANLRGGKLAVTIGESRAFGGVIRGSFSLGRHGEGAEVKSQLQFADVDLDACIGEIFGFRRLEGKGNLAVAIDATGQNVLGLARSLNGTAALTGRQGAVTGLDVEQLLRRLERRPLSGGGNEFRTGRTPYDKLSVVVKFSDGIASVDDVSIEGPAVRLVMAGSASIPARDFDLKGTASLLGTPTSDGRPSFELPFVVQGPWDDPIMLPDPQILIRRSGAAAPLLDALRDRQTRDALRSAIEKYGGGAKMSQPEVTPSVAPAPASEPAKKPPATPGAD
jgi:AsmA protein